MLHGNTNICNGLTSMTSFIKSHTHTPEGYICMYLMYLRYVANGRI